MCKVQGPLPWPLPFNPDSTEACPLFPAAPPPLVPPYPPQLLCTAEAGLPPITCLVVSGGVAANTKVRECLTRLAAQYKLPFLAPPPKFCSDNGLMVAWTGLLRLQQGLSRAPPPTLEQVGFESELQGHAVLLVKTCVASRVRTWDLGGSTIQVLFRHWINGCMDRAADVAAVAEPSTTTNIKAGVSDATLPTQYYCLPPPHQVEAAVEVLPRWPLGPVDVRGMSKANSKHCKMLH